VTLIAIYLLPEAKEEKVIEQIESEKRYLKVVSSPHLLGTSSSVDFVNTSAWVLSLIAVIMGCIGVLNTMSMSVSERTREIGILKAVGWSRLKVLRMILSESLLLSLVGFVIGSLLGVGAVWAITSLPSVKGFISPSFSGDSFLIGLTVALLLGFLGGAFPAYRASRLSPAEALRRE
jgi:putative ABC transport system permease protein